ncbi:porin [Scleromatobacter humisilvae]|uniref:Porin n=1 Tax=Scleromatobacter humisilvae TaxID=2897159 RepID=A0A9X2C2Q1_9BURK|nr:porin [Scleromatobacter humisilvae]MCK9688996.1 porin [Scleromatobacter humisilvae]
MKKSLLALAVLTAVSGVASAQSSVTLYGKVDLGLTLDSGSSSGKSVRLDSGVTGGSRIGFKGVEDLGGGMKAAFQLETGFCADSAAGVSSNGATVPNFCTGSNAFMGRQAHGDLTGAFGAISAGRQYSLGFNNLSTIDPFGTGFAGQVNNIVDPSGIRLNNSVTYSTPNIGGITASAEVAFGEQTGNWQANRETGAGLTYASGPAYAGFTFYDVANASGNGAARKNYLLGGTYDFGIIKLHALVQKSTGPSSLDVLDMMGGVTIPVAGGQVLASYIHHNDRTLSDKDAQQVGVGYLYPLSKRTSVYMAFARINNEHGAAFTVGNATATGTGDKAFNLGVVHNF